MAKTLSSQQVLTLAHCLTKFQSAYTAYELEHFSDLTSKQRQEIEKGLGVIADCAGRLYAYSVQLMFAEVQPQLNKLQEAAGKVEHFLSTVKKIQSVLDTVTVVVGLAASIISNDVEGISSGIDAVTGLFSKA